MSATAPRSDVKVGREMANPMGWLMRRTKDVEELLAIPEVMRLAQEFIVYLDGFCAVRKVDPKELTVNVLPTQSLRYITLLLGTDGCRMCDGRGVQMDGYSKCPHCEGTGYV
jgi:hypothetical protein